MVVRSLSPSSALAWRVKAMYRPSGDHDGSLVEPTKGGAVSSTLQVPCVSRRAAPPPAETSHRCDGRTSCWIRYESSWISKRSSPRFCAAAFGASSCVTYAKRVPSGLHAYCWTPLRACVISRGFPPRAGMTKIWSCLCDPLSTYARRSPLGDHCGSETDSLGRLSACGAPPVDETTSSVPMRLSRLKSLRVSTKATHLPSGDMRGEEMLTRSRNAARSIGMAAARSGTAAEKLTASQKPARFMRNTPRLAASPLPGSCPAYERRRALPATCPP